jgi:hypothetical protein
VIITYEGQRYPFQFEDITVKQGMKIEQHTGIPWGEWGEAVAAGGNLKVLQSLGWLVLLGGDLDAQIGECDFKMAVFGAGLNAAMAAEAAAAEAAEEAAGPRPTGGTSSDPREANGTAPPPTLSSAAAS